MAEDEQIRVLLVEDDEEDALLAREAVCELGSRRFRCEWVRSLKESLDHLKEHEIDVVLLDLNLPDSPGPGTFETLRLRCPSLPIVIMSGLDDEDSAIDLVRRGAQDYIAKNEIGDRVLGRVLRHAVERQLFEEALRESEEQLRQSQKMEAIGRLAGGIAHDFNNLLTVLLGNVELLGRKIPEDHPGRFEVGQIIEAGERAEKLTEQLLAFSRKQVIRPEVVDLNEVVLSMEEMVGRLIGGHIRIRNEHYRDRVCACVDKGQLEQVIMNLVVNARDAMPEGGELIFGTNICKWGENNVYKPKDLPAGTYAVMTVADTGMGMDEDTQEHCFEPFFTTKSEGKGTGLGLATSYGIIKRAGGSISVKAQAGKGTVFTICLPRVDEQPVSREETQAEVSEMPRGTETLLIVEDDEHLRGLSVRVLKELGYTVYEAHNGMEAIAFLKEPEGPKIKVMFSDVVMPKMGGQELAEQVLREFPDIRIILTSGYSESVALREGPAIKNTTYLKKPYTPQSLATLVRRTLDA